MDRLIIPRVSPVRLFSYYSSSGKGFKGSKKTIQAYKRAAVVLLSGAKSGMRIEEFRSFLAKRILEDLRAGEALRIVEERGLPLNPKTLSWAFSKLGINASVTTASMIISILKWTNALLIKPSFTLIDDQEDLIYHVVLSRGEVKFRKLEQFPNARKIVLDLVRKGKVGVRLRGAKLEEVRADDWDFVDEVEGIPEAFLEEWKGGDGVKHVRVVIPGNAIVYAIPTI